MSKRVQFAHSYPNLSSAPANESLRTVIFTKSDGVYAVLADGTVLGPLGSGSAPSNMVTTDSGQVITGTKTLSFNQGVNALVLDNATPASSGTTSISSPSIFFNTSRWNGSAAVPEGLILSTSRVSSAANSYYLATSGGGLGLRSPRFYATTSGQQARFVGGTTSGAPSSGTYEVGDYVVARNGKVWICTTAGTPGTWADSGGTGIDPNAENVFVTATEDPAWPTGTVWIDTDETPVAVTEAIEPFIFSVTGAVAVATGKSRVYLESGYVVESVRASVDTAPTGASLIVDVNLNGTSIFTTQSNRPTITAGSNTDLSGTPETITVAQGQYLTVDVDQVGSTVAGADLTVVIRLRRTA